jgi:hypothetical protein
MLQSFIEDILADGWIEYREVSNSECTGECRLLAGVLSYANRMGSASLCDLIDGTRPCCAIRLQRVKDRSRVNSGRASFPGFDAEGKRSKLRPIFRQRDIILDHISSTFVDAC